MNFNVLNPTRSLSQCEQSVRSVDVVRAIQTELWEFPFMKLYEFLISSCAVIAGSANSYIT